MNNAYLGNTCRCFGAGKDKVKEETGVTLRPDASLEEESLARCYPLQQDELADQAVHMGWLADRLVQVCPLTGKPARVWAIFARAY